MPGEVVDELVPEEEVVLFTDRRDGVDTSVSVQTQLLTVGSIELSGANLIKTDTFANGEPPLYGFGSIASSLVSLDQLEMTVGTADTGSIASSISTASVEIVQNSLSLGFLPAYTYENAPDPSYGAVLPYARGGQIFFHYSNKIKEEPNFALGWGDISDTETARDYRIGDPVNYDDGEATGLKLKFGVDPTIVPDSHGDITLQVLSASFDQLAEDLLTSYAISEKAFPRTPPLKVKKKEIGNIITTERTESDTGAPTTTTVTPDPTY